jgi:hypothetical protein
MDNNAEPGGGYNLPDLLVVQHHCVAPSHAMRQLDQRGMRDDRVFRNDRRSHQFRLRFAVFDCIGTRAHWVPVFIIRFAERKIDQFLDAALLDHSPMGSEFDSIKFESEWAFLRPFSSKKKAPPNVASGAPSSPLRTPTAASPGFNTRPPSPSLVPSSSRGFSSSLRHTFNRTRTSSSISTLNSLFADAAPPPMSPADLTSILTDLHTLLTISEINPILTTQLWSQVMYWTSCALLAHHSIMSQPANFSHR